MGKRNNSQRKENVESPRKEISENEACNMTEKEFRVMVMEFIHRMDEKINNLCKNQEEMKSDIATIKNTMESFNSRLQEAEDRISELEDQVQKQAQAEQQLEKKIKKQEESLRELRDNMKRSNMRIIGLPEGQEEQQGLENLFEEIMTENFPDMGKIKVTQVSYLANCSAFSFSVTGDPSVCSISNPDFVIYSSVVSFYLPFGVTVLVYARIYVVLRQRRRKRILTRQNSQCISVRPSFPQQGHSQDKQYPQKCQNPLLSHLQPLSPGRTHMELRRYYSICQDTAFGPPGFQEGEGELKKEASTRNSLSPTMAPKLSLEVRKLSNGRLSTSLKLGPLQPRGVPLREKKATQMLVIVLGTFIVCWLPFFLTHVLNTHCPACHVSPELYRATTWLGYVNSALNPVIYTTFNVEFRKAFLKILSC
ncbi:hypothetical protein QTO34_014462 [Cnephaeus nilssonii]|uniref:D(3) dopamine receptor n=1 Tax=Cnephaeus nilssonii TaxID=3371016 RepID=A0AA40LRX2_CNENI|nr:hypothetical protein QTO34_014462 [Eptesicus nilssonii]